MLKTAGKLAPKNIRGEAEGDRPAVSGILCLLQSHVYYFSSYLQRKVAPSSRPQGGNVPLSLGVWGKNLFSSIGTNFTIDLTSNSVFTIDLTSLNYALENLKEHKCFVNACKLEKFNYNNKMYQVTNSCPIDSVAEFVIQAIMREPLYQSLFSKCETVDDHFSIFKVIYNYADTEREAK